jgi:hypothetical protein
MEVSGLAVIVDGDTLWVGSQEVRIQLKPQRKNC